MSEYPNGANIRCSPNYNVFSMTCPLPITICNTNFLSNLFINLKSIHQPTGPLTISLFIIYPLISLSNHPLINHLSIQSSIYNPSFLILSWKNEWIDQCFPYNINKESHNHTIYQPHPLTTPICDTLIMLVSK